MTESTSTRRLAPAAWIGALVAASGALVFIALTKRVVGGFGLPLDDSWIHLQFARSLALGSGLAFEPGQLVPASTAPLWTAVLSLAARLPGPAALWSQIAGTLAFASAAVVLHGLARDLGFGRQLSALATLLYALSGHLVWSAVSGLEVPLFVLLTLTASRIHLRDRDSGRGIALSLPLFALASLARPEGLLLLLLALVDRGLAVRFRPSEWWRGMRKGLLVSAVVLVPVVAFNVLASGSLLPTTFAAKSGGVHSLWPSLRYLHTVFGILFRSQPYMTLLVGAGAVVLAQRLFTQRDRGVLPALWVLGLPLAYSCLSPPGSTLVGNFGRYYFPLLPFVIVLGCLGLVPVVERLGALNPAWRRVAMAVAFLLIAWPTVAHLRTTAGQFAQSVRDVETGDGAAARWLENRLAPGSTLAVNDIGLIKFILPEHRMYDLAGIVTPEVHHYTRSAVGRGESWETGIARYLERVRPDYLVVFPDWFPGLLASEVSFAPLKEFVVVGNSTLGGDRLVIYETPWTRQKQIE